MVSEISRVWAGPTVAPQAVTSVISSFEKIAAVPATLLFISFLLALFPAQ